MTDFSAIQENIQDKLVKAIAEVDSSASVIFFEGLVPESINAEFTVRYLMVDSQYWDGSLNEAFVLNTIGLDIFVANRNEIENIPMTIYNSLMARLVKDKNLDGNVISTQYKRMAISDLQDIVNGARTFSITLPIIMKATFNDNTE